MAYRPQKVLVVEDDDTVRHLLIGYLREHSSLEVEGAHDGADALHQVATGHYAVVVLDLMMPFMTGIDFLDSIEAMAADPSVKSLQHRPPVVVITGTPDEQMPSRDLHERFPSLVRAVFRKPLDHDSLARLVARLAAGGHA